MTSSRSVLFVHGAGDGAYEEDELLVASLRGSLGEGYEVHYPRMPASFEATFDDWLAPIENGLARLEEPAYLVGHSVGGSVLLKYLCTARRAKVAALHVMAAPFWGADDFWSWDEASLPSDAASRLAYVPQVFLYHARDDEVVPFAHLRLYQELFPAAQVRELGARGHQFGNDLAEVAQDIESLNEQ